MNDLHKMIIDLGIDPKISLALFILLATFLIVTAVLYICIPFLILRIRKEIIEVNKNLRNLYILDIKSKINGGGNEKVSDVDNHDYKERITKDNIKFQLDDDDIRKLKAIGLGIK